MNIWRTFEDFSGFDLHLRSIINVISLVLCQRLWDKFNPDLCHFQTLLDNFVYNVKAWSDCLANILIEPLLSLTKELSFYHEFKFSNSYGPIYFQPNGVNLWYFKLRLFGLTEFIVWNIKGLRHQFAKIQGLENLSLWQRLKSFSNILGSWWPSPTRTCHNPSTINVFLINHIKPPLKLIKIVLNSFWIMFKVSAWFLHRLIKTFFVTQPPKCSFFLVNILDILMLWLRRAETILEVTLNKFNATYWTHLVRVVWTNWQFLRNKLTACSQGTDWQHVPKEQIDSMFLRNRLTACS